MHLLRLFGNTFHVMPMQTECDESENSGQTVRKMEMPIRTAQCPDACEPRSMVGYIPRRSQLTAIEDY